ncbi:Kinesin light chain 3 [Nowakowskiella sp. JEL0407]|nr:Kinesin light chain 3 [Nowakowskiella sp. JEL0407]
MQKFLKKTTQKITFLFSKTPPISVTPPELTKDFSLTGIKISYLRQFIDENGGRKALEGKTTTEINDKIIKPTTSKIKDSMCEYLMQTSRSSCVGTATWFISHAWGCEFLKVVDSILDFFENDQPGADVTIWFDLFSNSQHETNLKPFDWWTGTFMNAIESLGNVLMVLMPWDDPIPLKRAWCVFELYACTFTKSRFEVGIPHLEKQKFLNDLKEHPGKYDLMLGSVKSENSQAFKKEDKDAIHDVIRQKIGFGTMDQMLFNVFRSWMIRTFRSHIETLAASGVGEEFLVEWTVSLATLHYNQGDFDAAESHYKSALEISERIGKSQIFILAIMNQLGLTLLSQSKYGEAEPILLSCLYQRKQILGEEHQDTLASINNLAVLYKMQRNFDAAETLYQDCLERTKRTLGVKHPDYLSRIFNLAELQKSRGNYDGAKSVYLENLKIPIIYLGKTHPKTLGFLSNLAEIYRLTGNYDDAEKWNLYCFEERTRILGATHKHTLTSMQNLAVVYDLQGFYEKAELLYVELITILERNFGTDHPEIITVKSNLAELYRKDERYDESESLCVTSLAKSQRILGIDHPVTLTIMNNLGLTYHMRHEYDKAEELYLDCISTRKVVMGENHSDTLTTMTNLASLYREREEYWRAEIIYLDCLDRFKQTLGENHPLTVNCFSGLEKLYLLQNEYAKSEQLRRDFDNPMFDKIDAILNDL